MSTHIPPIQACFLAAITNTTATTLSISGHAAKALVKGVSTALAAGDVIAGQMHCVTYSAANDNFQLKTPPATGGSGGGGGTGDVVGPSSSVDNTLVLFDSTTGKLVKAGTGCLVVSGVLTCTSVASGDGTATPGHVFTELAANGTDSVGWFGPDSLAASNCWFYPAADGNTGQFMRDSGTTASTTGLSPNRTCTIMEWSSLAPTATALAANGTNCSAGNYPLGVDASGNAESCTAAGSGGGGGVLPKEFLAAKCQSGTAGAGSSLPATLVPNPVCISGTNVLSGELEFPDSDGEYSIQDRFKLDTTALATAINLNIKWRAAATSGNVVWQLAGICVADAETLDPSFATAQTVTDTAKGTTLQVNDAQIATLTVTSCAAGETYFFRFFRDRTHASDTITGIVKLLSLEFTN